MQLQNFFRRWICYDCCINILTILFIMSVTFIHHCKYNWIWWDCHQSESFSALKPGLIHYFVHLKMPVPSEEYDSSCPFVFYVFCHLILPCDYGVSDWILLWKQYFSDFTFYSNLINTFELFFRGKI